MTTGEHLVQVAEAGLALSEVTLDEEDVYARLTVLLAIEDTLDQGRIILSLSGSGVEHKQEIEEKMDELRSRIRRIVDQCDTDEFAAFMKERGDRLKLQVSP